jgi:phosphoserine phosphatase
MDIGLFLDVDNTLTVGFIQQRFASLLGVQNEYSVIEDAFQREEISSPEFGERIIALFNGAGFNEEYAKKHYSDVKQAAWVDDLLQLPATKYLVSSGPSYFVRPFAQQHGIPEKNVLCSEYIFQNNGMLERCKAVTGPHKQDFVAQRSEQHWVTIGLGDSFLKDGPFITACDIPILTSKAQGALAAESLETVRTLVSKLSRRGLAVPRTTRTRAAEFLGPGAASTNPTRCFVIMPYSERWSNDVQKIILEACKEVGFEFTIAKSMEGRFVPNDIWNGITGAGVIVADLSGANPNVTYEVGLADVLGREVIMICQSTKVPFDFLGQRLIQYEDSLQGASRLREELTKRLHSYKDRIAAEPQPGTA